MPDRRRRGQSAPPAPPPAPAGSAVALQVKLPTTRDVPVHYANLVSVNFTGFEFYVTVMAAVPEPWGKGEQPNPEIEARVLARFAFSPQAWAEAVRSFSEQVDNLRKEGALALHAPVQNQE